MSTKKAMKLIDIKTGRMMCKTNQPNVKGEKENEEKT